MFWEGEGDEWSYINIHTYNVYVRKIHIFTCKPSGLCIKYLFLRSVQNLLYIRTPGLWLYQISILKDTLLVSGLVYFVVYGIPLLGAIV